MEAAKQGDLQVMEALLAKGRSPLGLPGFRYNAPMEALRAASRTGRITERRFASLTEAQRHDWREATSVPAAERMALVWQLSRELWAWRGESLHEPGLCRSVAVVHRP
jgi:hypothetical protein